MTRTSIPIASSAPTRSSCRSTAPSATTCSCRPRTGRSTSCRASRSTRCSAPCRRRRTWWSCRSRRSTSATRRTSSTWRRCGRSSSTPTPSSQGPGSTVAKIADGTLQGHTRTGIAGVANTGSDRNWSGHDFAPANWYAFGRLAWNPAQTSAGHRRRVDPRRPGAASPGDRQGHRRDHAAARARRSSNYTMPLGLHHLIGGNHYAVMPENDDPRRLDWSATYYHRADEQGVGFDRTRDGSGAVDQYAHADRRPVEPRRRRRPRTCCSGSTTCRGTTSSPLARRSGRGSSRTTSAAPPGSADGEGLGGAEGGVDDERHAAVAAKLTTADDRRRCLARQVPDLLRPVQQAADRSVGAVGGTALVRGPPHGRGIMLRPLGAGMLLPLTPTAARGQARIDVKSPDPPPTVALPAPDGRRSTGSRVSGRVRRRRAAPARAGDSRRGGASRPIRCPRA